MYEWGTLGLGNRASRDIPVQILNLKAKQILCSLNHTLLIDLDNNLWSFGITDIVN